jgi:hypothetical protein
MRQKSTHPRILCPEADNPGVRLPTALTGIAIIAAMILRRRYDIKPIADYG